MKSRHRTYDGTQPIRHYPLYVGTGHAKNILRSNAVIQFKNKALYGIEQYFGGKYPKICVTVEKAFGTSRMEQLTRYFNFALNRGPPYTLFENYNNECKVSEETETQIKKIENAVAPTCGNNAESEKLRRQKRNSGKGKVKKPSKPGKSGSCTKIKKIPNGKLGLKARVHTIGMY